MIVNASLDRDSVMVLSWRAPKELINGAEGVSFKDIGAVLTAVGFTVYELIEPGAESLSEMIAVPLPSIDHDILSKYVHHVLESRLGVWDKSSTTWTHNGWMKVVGDVKLEKY